MDIDRRDFLKSSGVTGLAWIASSGLAPVVASSRMLAAPQAVKDENPNWAIETFKPKAQASSYFADPPWGYLPENIFNEDEHTGWEAGEQLAGAWVQIDFPAPRAVSELWILGRPCTRDVVGSDPYLATFSRTQFYAIPRKVRCTLSDGSGVTAELRDADWYQIVRFPGAGTSKFVRIQIEDVWGRPGVLETGIAKVKIFPERHQRRFEIDDHAMYDVHDGRPVQTATLKITNPDAAIDGARLSISEKGDRPVEIPLATIPARAVSRQPVWIPAPFRGAEMEFKIVNGSSAFSSSRSLRIPSFHSYFEGGSYAIHCTCHNDLGWLDTQEETGDFRSEKIILPALRLLNEYPEFRYSMESPVYLMEFLERHPQRREEIAGHMRDGRFAWGASYVQCLEVHVGLEKLARQFYLGRRWLRNNFPGVDSHTYLKTDPPGLTIQMPQILRKAGIKYLLQGLMPFGFYWWQGLDGSTIFTYGLTAAPLTDASDAHYLGRGCLAASDTTVHLFHDDTDHPISDPLLQHVLLCTRKSQSWNPLNWFTQNGTHRYRVSVMPHADNWRTRYQEAIGFNYPLLAFFKHQGTAPSKGMTGASGSFLQLDPANLVITALKKSEEGEQLALRFYEAEGFGCEARIRFSKPIAHASQANLIEDKEEWLRLEKDGSLRVAVKPWEIVTLLVAL